MENIKMQIVNKRFLIVLFLGVISGTLFANFFGTKHINDWGIFDQNYIEKYNSIMIDYSKLWQYVAADRLRDIIFLAIISLTAISIPIFLLYLYYIGLGIGLVISMTTMQYGIFGLWIYIVSIFPQYIFYGLALYFISKVISKNNLIKKDNYRIAISLFISIVLVLIGICVETFINPNIMKHVIYNMY